MEPRAQRHEAERLAALDALLLLDSPAEPRFDRITRITQRHFRVSIALVGLVGADRVWFKSKQGTAVCHTPRITSFCERAIQGEGVFCVHNALEDPDFSANPFVSGPSNIRFYAGVPLHAPGGQRIGTLGILDRGPRTMARADSEALLDFGALVDEEIAKGFLTLQERRLRSIIDGTRIGTWEWNVQTGECEFNERWAGMAGYTLAELAPVSIQTWFDLAHPDDLRESNVQLERHFRRETEYYDCYCRMRHRDGHWVWIHDRGRVVKWTDDGRPALLSGTHIDVTAEKEARVELEVSQARLRGLFDRSPVGIALNDFETGAFVQVNDALLESTGYSRDEILRLCYTDITPREYLLQDRRHLRDLRTLGRYSGHEKEFIRKDGDRYPVLLNGVLVRDSAGRKLVWSIVEDISEHQALLHQTERQRNSLHSLLDQLEIGTLLLEPDGHVGFVSRYCSSLGLNTAATVGRHWSEVLPLREEGRSRLGQQLQSAPDQRQPFELDWRRDGREFFIECEIRDAPTDALGRHILCLKDVSEVRRLQRQLAGGQSGAMIGNSEPMHELYRHIGDVARGDWTVLIEGETGVGKELVARSIHESSERRNGPFIAVNSAGLSGELIHSQLFGHTKGAFTGAVTDRQGCFEAASEGTLFLDEIGDLSSGMQSSLLRVLQEKEIVRLGEALPRKVDVRILAATNKDLANEVAAGRFRQDLFYRLRVARVHVPALRERREDIPLLVAYFLGQTQAGFGEAPLRCGGEAMNCLLNHPWPGNVRELKAIIDHAVIYRRGDVIRCVDLPEEIACGPGTRRLASAEHDGRARILAALERTGGNCSRAAELLGISRTTLYRHMARLGITAHPDRTDPQAQP